MIWALFALVALIVLLAGVVWCHPAAGRGSFLMRGTVLLLRLLGNQLSDSERYRASVEGRRSVEEAPVPQRLKSKFAVTERMQHGYPVITIGRRRGGSRWHILYMHGGAYVSGMVTQHWDIIEKLIEHTGATVTVPLYPLAPEHDYIPAHALMLDIYKDLVTQVGNENIVLAGDSAGGGFALAQAMTYRDLGLPQPARLVLFSPWLDLSMQDTGAVAVERVDPTLAIESLRISGRWWAGDENINASVLSPLFGHFDNLPPIDIFQGTLDVFVVDARTAASKIEAAGGVVNYHEYEGCFHVFVGATWTSEARDAYARIGSVLR